MPRYHFKISIENREGGQISLTNLLSDGGGNEPIAIGTVLRRATSIRSESFRASKHGEPGTVVASAVNAIHLKLYSQGQIGKGATLSIYPKELYGKSLMGNPEAFHPYVIYTDIPAGAYLFGGSLSPIPGSSVKVIGTGKATKLGFGYVPSEGDVLQIEVMEPEDPLKRVLFENVKGGKVIVERQRGVKEVVAKVLKPVTGVGRFEGSVLCPENSIRAVHSAVIDISTSRKGKVGGFQIIPARHAVSREMVKAVLLPQWMLIIPTSSEELAGTAPLFSGYLFPRTSEDEDSILRATGRDFPNLRKIPRLPRMTILGDFGNGFEPLPTLEGRDENALKNLKILAIEFREETTG